MSSGFLRLCGRSPMLKQVQLRSNLEPLQIPYPPDFEGEKSGEPEDEEFFLDTVPRFLTSDECAVAKTYIQQLHYPQELIYTGCTLIDSDDPLLEFSQEQLDELEKTAQLASTSEAPGGGRLTVQQRVLLIREGGYEGDGKKALNGSKK